MKVGTTAVTQPGSQADIPGPVQVDQPQAARQAAGVAAPTGRNGAEDTAVKRYEHALDVLLTALSYHDAADNKTSDVGIAVAALIRAETSCQGVGVDLKQLFNEAFQKYVAAARPDLNRLVGSATRISLPHVSLALGQPYDTAKAWNWMNEFLPSMQAATLSHAYSRTVDLPQGPRNPS